MPNTADDAIERVAKVIDPDAWHHTLPGNMPDDGSYAHWRKRRYVALEKAKAIAAMPSSVGDAVRDGLNDAFMEMGWSYDGNDLAFISDRVCSFVGHQQKPRIYAESGADDGAEVTGHLSTVSETKDEGAHDNAKWLNEVFSASSPQSVPQVEIGAVELVSTDEDIERDIRIAIWNAAMNGGMGQDLSQAFIRRAMAEPTMVRALAALTNTAPLVEALEKISSSQPHLPATMSAQIARQALSQYNGKGDRI
ncbi:hypothetical protein IC614_02840 [Allosphingosinicella flava]|uniref:Uncharacterized protein n=1 Tax=Allosphingosinicella flava TaxID=2771430 RepID=A0A7T2LMF9_9SPHN|nr:hypothetical protein [Sphingosinicella flava]QPQ55555.1 hypothetical protein IC614_02840 [Sphingosinicella flava]